jgi:curved DNA-binding protein CbpA
MDLYEILEIKPNASEVEIKKAYFRLAKIYHPDKNRSEDAAEKFQKIQSAYEILINDKTRQEYTKMNQDDKFSFVNILEKIIKDNFDLNELKKYGISLEKNDFDYLERNFMNFFRAINVTELLDFFKKGVVNKKNFNNIVNCSESDMDIFDETSAEYYYSLPISLQKVSQLDIRIDLSIKLGDIAVKNKRKIKIKRNINGKTETSTFVFNLESPYVVFVGAGDFKDQDYGNLIVKLNLPNNLFWNDSIILIEQSMNLYEMIYGMDICLELGEGKKISIQNWVPSRDGFLVEISNTNNKNIESNIILSNYNLAIKLFLNYEDSEEKEQILKQYFS